MRSGQCAIYQFNITVYCYSYSLRTYLLPLPLEGDIVKPSIVRTHTEAYDKICTPTHLEFIIHVHPEGGKYPEIRNRKRIFVRYDCDETCVIAWRFLHGDTSRSALITVLR